MDVQRIGNGLRPDGDVEINASAGSFLNSDMSNSHSESGLFTKKVYYDYHSIKT